MNSYNIRRAELQDLPSIRALLQKNLHKNVSEAETQKEGFVSVDYSPSLLENILIEDGIIVAEVEDGLIGYTLPLTKEKAQQIPMLLPFLERLKHTDYKGKPVSEQTYVIAGQICIAKEHRGKDIPKKIHDAFLSMLKGKYNLVVTEVSPSNPRSLHVATEKLGMQTIDTYAADGKEWHILVQELSPR